MGTDTDLGFIAPELHQFAEPIGTYQPHPENARDHDLEKIAGSLSRHGQRSPVIVQRSTGYIVKGNGTQAAARMLGWEHLAFLVQDFDDARARLYLLDDNRASDHARYIRKRERTLLKNLVSGPDPLMASMFDEGEFVINDLQERLADIDDEEDGAETVETDVTADFAPNTFAAKAQKAEPKLPGEKMREVPLVLAIADYNEFIGRITALQKRYGTGGRIATIMEAVKRQYEAEDGAEPFTGKAPVTPPIAEGQTSIEDAFNHSDELLDAALGAKS